MRDSRLPAQSRGGQSRRFYDSPTPHYPVRLGAGVRARGVDVGACGGEGRLRGRQHHGGLRAGRSGARRLSVAARTAAGRQLRGAQFRRERRLAHGRRWLSVLQTPAARRGAGLGGRRRRDRARYQRHETGKHCGASGQLSAQLPRADRAAARRQPGREVRPLPAVAGVSGGHGNQQSDLGGADSAADPAGRCRGKTDTARPAHTAGRRCGAFPR